MPEKRIVLKNCGIIDPHQITTYIERDGFKALEKAKATMSPQQVISEIKASGLRGRGGAGFPCGLKWELASQTASDEKYVICNADEGEIGTFKDRYILEHDPFTLIEGIGIAAYAIGARMGYIYLRGEYHYLLGALEKAIRQAEDCGYLPHIKIRVCEGAGAYVCGEESALMDSIEGRRGEVRYRPPFPPTRGLWGKPTVINNVETLMNVPHIILNGAQWFSQIGTERSKGTKVFSVSGDVARPGVYEMVMGTPLVELVEQVAQARDVRMVQVGGATGRILPYEEMIKTPLAFEAVLGAGAVIVFNRGRDVVEIVYRTIEFLAEESCGKCSPCREGTAAMAAILERFSRGQARENDIKLLEEVSSPLALASICGLGQAAPTPVLDTLRYFRGDYEKRINKSRVDRVEIGEVAG